MKERLPRILTQSIDILVRHKDDIGNEYGKVSLVNIALIKEEDV